jgi:hypothetical protein
MVYSESKKKDKSVTPKLNRSTFLGGGGGDADESMLGADNRLLRLGAGAEAEAESPLEMLRYALLQLSNVATSGDNSAAKAGPVLVDASVIASITSLLQVSVLLYQSCCLLLVQGHNSSIFF